MAALTCTARAPAEGHCGSVDDVFASCPGTTPLYRSVVVAIHGWNGSCAETFGSGEESVFRVLGERRFFDFDCFAYDSRRVSIAENVRRLREHVAALAGEREGYRHAMLVTHSTGGVIALRALTDALLDDAGVLRRDLDGERILHPEGLRIHSVQAWATPINGLRTLIDLGSGPVALMGYSPETLSELDPASEFLRELKARLAALERIRRDTAVPLSTRARIEDLAVNLFQGQGDDWVVVSIDPVAARREKWVWDAGRGAVVDTGLGHGHNIAATGEVGKPRLPGHVMELELLLRLPFTPIYENAFRDDYAVVPPGLAQRQGQLVRALELYATHRFAEAMFPALDFLALMLTREFSGRRDRDVDAELVAGLLRVLETRSARPDEHLVQFLAAFVHGVLAHVRPGGGEDLRRVGHNHSDVLLDLQRTIVLVHRAVLGFVRAAPALRRAALIAPFASVEDFDVAVQSALARFFGTRYHTVQNLTVASTREVVERSSPPALERSPLLDDLGDFYERHYATLPQAEKSSVAVTMEIAAAASASLRHRMLARWNAEVPHLDTTRPLWATLNDDEAVSRIVARIPPGSALDPAEARFLAAVASLAGSSGRNVDLARDARDRILFSVGRVEEPGRVREFAEILRAEGTRARLPIVERRFEAAAERMR